MDYPTKLNPAQPQTIYCIGIGGIGLSGLTQLLRSDGHNVSGSDAAASPITKRLQQQGVVVGLIQDGSTLSAADLVVYSDAVPQDHPERAAARAAGIPEQSYFAALGNYAKQFSTVVAVSGTHGKSTTTAMLGLIAVQAGRNPTVLVGSQVPAFDNTIRSGGRDLLIVEACEHQAHMLHIPATHIVITNIEAEHLDFYADEAAVVATFQQFVDQLPDNGVLISNAGDRNNQTLQTKRQQITYGLNNGAVHASRLKAKAGTQTFQVNDDPYLLQVPGEHNVSNAVAAIAAAGAIGIDAAACQAGLAAYTGIWRRFEILGAYRKAVVVSDYAHHPTEIRAAIAACRQAYPDKRIVAVFQPHLRSRTKAFLMDFAAALTRADFVIIEEIYSVTGREQDIDVSSRDIAAAMEAAGSFPVFTPDRAATRSAVDDMLDTSTVLLIMGAGDIYTLAENLCQN